MDEFLEVLPLVAPLFVIWLVMLVAGLRDLIRRERTRGPKWIWYLIVILFSVLGPTVYFLFGREES
jgi:hypothetical protein